jgi:conserved oligomeric Golgi complex subunit 3
MLIRNLFLTHEIPDAIRQSAELDLSPFWETIGELQARKQLFNPLAYINPLMKGQLLPAVVDRVHDARKKLEGVLAKQIMEFTKYWQSRLTEKGQRQEAVLKANRELEEILEKAALEETTKEGLWRIIRAEEL